MKKTILLYLVVLLLVLTTVFAEPVFETSSPYEVTILEDDLFTLYLNISDNSLNFPITYETTAYDQNIEFNCFYMEKINDTQLLINFTPENEFTGFYEFYVIAENVNEEDKNFKFKINVTNVNDDPSIVDTGPLYNSSVLENETLNLYAVVEDDDLDTPEGDVITYTWLLDGVVSLKLNGTKLSDEYSSALYSPNISEFDAGIYNITVIANDSFGQYDSYTWNITVINVNRPPEFTGYIWPITWYEDNNLTDNLTLTDYFSDPDANGTLQEIDTGNDLDFGYVILDENGTIVDVDSYINISFNISNVSFYPDKDWYGNMTIRFYMDDNNSADNIIYSNPILLTVIEVNDPPVVQPIDNVSIYSYTYYEKQVQAIDPDNDTLYYYIDTDLNSSINSSGHILIHPEFSDAGNHTVNITVGDGTVNVSVYFEIEVIANHPPEILPFQNRTVAQYGTIILIINGTDLDSEQLTFSSNSTLLQGVRYNDTSWNFTISPTSQLVVGNNTIKVFVEDTHSAQAYFDFNLEVTDTKVSPIIYNMSFPNDQIKVGTFLNQIIYAWDEDEDIDIFDDNSSLFNIITQSTGDFYNNATGLISFTPGSIGYHEINISVNDTLGYVDSFILRMNITDNHVPVWTIFDNITCPEDSTCSTQFEAQDEDWQDTILYGDNSTLFDINSTSGMIEFLPTIQGFYNVTFWVSDGTENITLNLSVNITMVNDPPYFTENVSNMVVWDQIREGQIATFNLTAIDEENDSITLDAQFINFTNLANITSVNELFNITNQTINANNSVTGTIDVLPSADDAGAYWVNISACDPYSCSFYLFNFSVDNINNPPEVNWTLVYGNLTVESANSTYRFNATENKSVHFESEVFDRDFDSWNYTWEIDYFENTETISHSQSLDYTLNFLTAPESEIRLIVTDENNGSTTITWTLDVENINRPCYFGKYIYLFDEHVGSLSDTEIVDGNLQAEEIYPNVYENEGNYISDVISFELNSNDYFPILNLTQLSLEDTGSDNYSITTYTSTSEIPGTAKSNMIMTSLGTINSDEADYLSFRINITNVTDTPIIHEVDVGYEFTDIEDTIGAIPPSYPGCIILSDFFKDYDDDDDLTYNYTILEGASLISINITDVNGESQVDLKLLDEGTARVKFTADDGHGSTAESNTLTIRITQDTQREQTSSSSGGTRVITKTQYQDVKVPISLSILHPENVTVYSNDTIEIPVELRNNNDFNFNDLTLWLESESDDISLKLDRYEIDELRKGETQEVLITADIDNIEKAYGIYMTVNISDPSYVDTAKVLISPLKRGSYDNESMNLKFAFVKDLLQKNAECSELSEYISRAQSEMKSGNYAGAGILLDGFVNDCKALIKDSKNIDQPVQDTLTTRLNGMFFKDEELFVVGLSILVITIFTIIVAIFMYRKV